MRDNNGIWVSSQLASFCKYDRTCVYMLAFLAKAKEAHGSSLITKVSDYKIYKEYGVAPKLFHKILNAAKLRRLVRIEGNNIRIMKIRERNGYNIKVHTEDRTLREIADQIYVGIGEKFIHDMCNRQQDSVTTDSKRRSNDCGVRLADTDRVPVNDCHTKGLILTNEALSEVLHLGMSKTIEIKKQMLKQGNVIDLAGYRGRLVYDDRLDDAIKSDMVEEYASYLSGRLQGHVFPYAPKPFKNDIRLYLQKCSKYQIISLSIKYHYAS